MRNLHPADPRRWNWVPRKTMITTSRMRRLRSDIFTLRFLGESGQGGQETLVHRSVCTFINRLNICFAIDVITPTQ